VIGNEWQKILKWEFGEFGDFCIFGWVEKKILNLRLRWWCVEHARSLTQWGGEGSSWPTTFVTSQLLVWSPTYFEIIYDLWGQQNLLLTICGFCPWLTLKYYMTLRARKNLLLAICGFCPWLMLKYYMTQQVNRVSDTKFMCSAIIPHFCVKVTSSFALFWLSMAQYV